MSKVLMTFKQKITQLPGADQFNLDIVPTGDAAAAIVITPKTGTTLSEDQPKR